jgi:hypothetical protein
MNIQCIALDLDRTTLNAQGRLSEGNRAALEYAISKGVHVVIASGRSFTTLPKDVLAVPGIEYAVTSNGAAIYYVPTATCLRQLRLSAHAVAEILRLTAGEPVVYEAFIDGHAFADRAYVLDPVRYGATPEAVAYVQETRQLEQDMVGFLRAHADQLESMDIVVHNEPAKERIWQTLAAAIPEIYLTSSVQQLVEIAPRDAGKHNGVRFLADHLGLPMAAIAAFGDADNDREMLAEVGCGIAVGNATPGCRAAADFVTAPHDEDGVARGIYEILGI